MTRLCITSSIPLLAVLACGSGGDDASERASAKLPLPNPAASPKKPPQPAKSPGAPDTASQPGTPETENANVFPIQMNWAQAEKFLESKGYKPRQGRDPNSLRGEDGLRDSIVFDYAEPRDEAPPVCVGVFNVKALDWRAIIKEYAGADARGLQSVPRKPVLLRGPTGDIQVTVEKGAFGVYLGSCE